jgi:MEMO1 family protein
VRRDDTTSGPADYARRCVECYVCATPRPPAPPEPLFCVPAACFVSIKKLGDLRGCIGTLAPVEADLGGEIARNARSAASQDPRFRPLAADELDACTYSVDVLGDLEPCAVEGLDPRRFGVVVACGWRRGVLLPGLPGVDEVATQLRIVLDKAGIRADEPFTVERFVVMRYREGERVGEPVGGEEA